jgi:RING finger protein 121
MFTGLGLLLPSNPDTILEIGVTLIFYGVYYGVLGRDFAEVCVDFMSAAMTYTTGGQSLPKVQLSGNMCAVCGHRIILPSEDEKVTERTYRLGCGHLFHEFCIRGWCIVGKKQTCPYCQEKVELKKIFKNPWEKPHLLFGQMLDFLRYCVVWLPVILSIVHLIYYIFHLE